MRRYVVISSVVISSIVAIALGYFWWQAGSRAFLQTEAPQDTLSPEETKLYQGKRILYLDSSDPGYDWSEGITRGVHTIIDGSGAELKVEYFDGRRNTDAPSQKIAGQKAADSIVAYKPDVLITCDEQAFTYVIATHFKDATMPIVFCGLNWDASLYGAPYPHMTGMVEVSLADRLVDHLARYSSGNRLGYIAADTQTERTNVTYYKKVLNLNFNTTYFVKDFTSWKDAFRALQNEVDIILIENNAGIAGWDDIQAENFVREEIQIPVGTTNAWMMPYALMGIAKIPEEQGEWSAQTALRILDGTKPEDIPPVKNIRGTLMLNLTTADILNVVFSPSILKNAEIVK